MPLLGLPIPISSSIIDSKGHLLDCRALHLRRLPDVHVGRTCAKPEILSFCNCAANRDLGTSVHATDCRPCHAGRSRRLILTSLAFSKCSYLLVGGLRSQAHYQALRCWPQSSKMDGHQKATMPWRREASAGWKVQ